MISKLPVQKPRLAEIWTNKRIESSVKLITNDNKEGNTGTFTSQNGGRGKKGRGKVHFTVN